MPCSISDILREARGQATVEAALLLPSLLVVLAVLLEPACVLYTRSVMASTAAELCRLLVTRRGDVTDDEVKAFALRRLRAVPECVPFHGGGEGDWAIEASSGAASPKAEVTIRGHVPLLPLFSLVGQAFGVVGEEGLELSVSASEDLRPSWLEGGYGDWVSIWQ